MKIWYQSLAPLAHLDRYVAALKAHAAKACSPGTTVHFNGASDAQYLHYTPQDLMHFPYLKLAFQQEAIGFARQAEREGYDAFILGSFSEPFLPEIRSMLDIPVVSMPEAALLLACSLAENFALITLGPGSTTRVKKLVARHGMTGRITQIQQLLKPIDEAELDAAFTDPAPLLARFAEVAEPAVGTGADAIIPAEGVLNEVLFANGVHSIGRATVVDCVGASFIHAEMLVAAKQRLGMGVGRRWAYPKPSAELLAELKL